MTQAQSNPAAPVAPPPPRSVDLAAYAAALRRRWKFVAAAAVLGVVVGWFLAPGPAPKVRLSGSGQFEATNTVLQNITDTKITLDRVKYLATLGEVPRRVAQKIGYPNDPMLLTSEIEIETDAQVGVIRFSSTQTDGALATQLANAFADETLAYVADVQGGGGAGQAAELKSRINQIDEQLRSNPAFANTLTQQREDLSRQLTEAESRTAAGAPAVDTGLKTIEPAVAREVVDDASKASKLTGKISRPIWVAVIALFVTIIGAGLALVLDRIDRRLRTREETKAAYGESVLAEIPLPARKDGITLEPQSASAEGMRMLRTVLAAAPVHTAKADRVRIAAVKDANGNGGHETPSFVGRSVLVTSASPGDGKTLTAVNLAMAYTEHQQRVLLVDANLRSPDLSAHFAMAGAPGLSELSQQPAIDGPTIARVCQPTQNPYLFVLPAGLQLDRPSALLRGVRQVLDLAPTLCDVVIVDSAALLVANDTRELLDACEGVLIVVTLDQTTTPAAEETRELLDRLTPDVYGIAMFGAAGRLGTSVPKMAAPKSKSGSAPAAVMPAAAPVQAGAGEAAATVQTVPVAAPPR